MRQVSIPATLHVIPDRVQITTAAGRFDVSHIRFHPHHWTCGVFGTLEFIAVPAGAAQSRSGVTLGVAVSSALFSGRSPLGTRPSYSVKGTKRLS